MASISYSTSDLLDKITNNGNSYISNYSKRVREADTDVQNLQKQLVTFRKDVKNLRNYSSDSYNKKQVKRQLTAFVKSYNSLKSSSDQADNASIKKEMDKLLNEYLGKQNISFDDILDFHVKFERIHPFQDGNGRTGRIIMFKECLKYNIVPFIIEDNLKMFYYRGLKEWDNEKGYLRDTCLTAQDRYKKLLDYFEIKYEN